MFWKLLILALVIIGILLMGLAIKLFFNKTPDLDHGSCALESGELNMEGACSKCEIKDLVNCTEKERYEKDEQTTLTNNKK